MQDTGDQPDDVTVSPEAASPPEPESVVVVELTGGCFYSTFANSPTRLVLIRMDEDFDEESENVIEVDGQRFSVQQVAISPEDGIDADTAKMLKAAGIDVPGLSVATADSEATFE
jgi:hypothetical protein